MAWGMIGHPGTKSGPCVKDCTHSDCRESRETSRAECSLCNRPIGFERKYCTHEGKTVHWICALQATHSEE